MGPIQIIAIEDSLYDSDDDDSKQGNLGGWRVKELSTEGIEIELEFRDPLSVSTGDDADFIFVQIELPDASIDSDSTSYSVVKKALIPPQI